MVLREFLYPDEQPYSTKELLNKPLSKKFKLNNNNDHSWDAATYDKVSHNVQAEWGRKLIEKRKWIGNEIVMDAGAGSGNLTKILANKVPHGQIYAVDDDPNMVEQAKFRDIQINLSTRTTSFSDRDEFAIFVKTVIMKPFLGYLPNAKKREEFLRAFLREIELSRWKWSLDYVRLGIFARK